jgi:tetratricopeptide (TPR) repeat protein
MFTEDYILRMINQAVAVLLKALGLRKKGQYAEAHQEVDLALELVTGLRALLLYQMDDESLVELLVPKVDDTKSLSGAFYERLWVTADLLREKGEIFAAQGLADESTNFSLRALYLFLEASFVAQDLHLPDKQPSPPSDEIHRLRSCVLYSHCLQAVPLPQHIALALFAYDEATGQYASAMQDLQQLLDRQPDPLDNRALPRRELLDEGRDFYMRLLQKTDVELNQGGVERTAIEKALRALN